MKINRRLLIAGTLAALVPAERVLADSIVVPTPDEVWTILKGDPRALAPVLAGVDALTRVLVLLTLQTNPGMPVRLEEWFKIRVPFGTPLPFAEIQSSAYTAEGADIITKAGEAVRPTASRIEAALAEGGLAPGRTLEKEMLRGFILFVQMKAAAERKAPVGKQAWYCEVYPFSFFCTTAG
jgi:hypothetical protein